MMTLTDLLKTALNGYVGNVLNGHSYLTVSADGQAFTVIAVATINGERFVNTGLFVRLVDGLIVIERDVNDKPLVDALLQAGVPRTQIVLAYAGEPVKETI